MFSSCNMGCIYAPRVPGQGAWHRMPAFSLRAGMRAGGRGRRGTGRGRRGRGGRPRRKKVKASLGGESLRGHTWPRGWPPFLGYRAGRFPTATASSLSAASRDTARARLTRRPRAPASDRPRPPGRASGDVASDYAASPRSASAGVHRRGARARPLSRSQVCGPARAVRHWPRSHARGLLLQLLRYHLAQRTSNLISFVDSSWLTAGLAVARQAFPSSR